MKKGVKKIFDDGKEMVDPVRLDPIEEAKEAYKVFANTLMTLKELFHEFDASNFFKEQGIKKVRVFTGGRRLCSPAASNRGERF